MKQQEKETLREYVKCFNKAVLEIDESNNDLVFSLGKTPPATMTNLLFKAQKFMNGEDALTANGINGKQNMEEINELQHKKKGEEGLFPQSKD